MVVLEADVIHLLPIAPTLTLSLIHPAIMQVASIGTSQLSVGCCHGDAGGGGPLMCTIDE